MAPKYLHKLQDKSIVIIGGTSGLGYAAAEASIEHGARIVIASRRQSNVDAALERLKAAYPYATDRIGGHIVDLGSDDIETSVKSLFEFATNGNRDRVDHVITSAGEGIASMALNTTSMENIIDGGKTRIAGSLLLCKVAVAYLKNEYTSSITFTGGALYYRPLEGFSVTVATAGGMGPMAMALAVDLKPIRVNIVSPGPILTDLLAQVLEKEGNGDSTHIVEAFKKRTLLDRLGTPEDVAEIYLSIMKSGYITGTVVHVEGGTLLK